MKLIDVAKKNKADWIILQPLIKRNTTDEDCYKFFKKLIPVANDTIVGIQNAKEFTLYKTAIITKKIDLIIFFIF